jgi:hypothetical protein
MLLVAPLVGLWLRGIVRYRRERAADAAAWRARWEPIAQARSLRIETERTRDLNGGPGFHQTWYALLGNLGSMSYRVGLGIITYGYDGLMMVEAAIPRARPATLVLTTGATSPLAGLTAVDLAGESLRLFCDDREAATSICSPGLLTAVKALDGAQLVIREHHVQVVLPVTWTTLDLATLDAGVRIVSVLVREAAPLGDHAPA